MGNKIVVTDACTSNGELKVTNLSTGESIKIPQEADAIKEAYKQWGDDAK